MTINFFESSDVPQPKDKIRIERLEVQPYPDGRRVKVSVEVTPFQERPNLEIRLASEEGQIVSELSVIETMHRHMEFTIHIRGVTSPAGRYVTGVELYYGNRDHPQDRREAAFTVESK